MNDCSNSLDRHFDLPQIRQVEASRPLVWLRRAWDDLQGNPGGSLPYGFALAAIGFLILFGTFDLPYLFTAAVSGFLLVGPLAAAGCYEISRRHQHGEAIDFVSSLQGLRQHADQLLYYGAFLAFILIGWERLSAILFALFYGGGVPNLGHFLREVFLSGDYWLFAMSYLVMGGALAALVFVLSAVSIPMLIDRDVDLVTAMMTSARAMMAWNPAAMAVWAAIIIAAVAIGFATLLLGLVVLLPLLGHAAWHAYRDLVE